MAVEPAERTDTLALTVNGQAIALEGVGSTTLLDVLRDRLGIISPKDGCQPLGQCGCCTVLIDGKPRLSCTLKATAVAGKSVTTLEGLPDETRKQIADCYVEAGGVQCGFCIPGMAVRCHALLERNPNPSREEIANDLRAHLCRCTGYTKIVDAIELLGQVRRGECSVGENGNGCGGGGEKNGNGKPPLLRGGWGGVSEAEGSHAVATPPPAPPYKGGSQSAGLTMGRVGTRLPRYTGHDAVLGDRLYIDDIVVPGMVFGAMRFSDHPRALVKKIDTSAAAALTGVLRVATATDVPGDRYVGLIEQDWPVFIAEGEETRCVGDILAAVAAVDEVTARRAADLIAVEYEVLTPITNPQDGLKPDAPKIHPKGNLLSRAALVRGDVDKALAESAHVVEGHWQTQRIEHMYLEPEAAIAMPYRLADGTPADWRELLAREPYRSAAAHGYRSAAVHGDRNAAAHFSQRKSQGRPSLGFTDDVAFDLAARGTVWGIHLLSQGQGVFDDRRQCCKVLNWPLDKMTCELVSNGGAFGGKEDMSIQGQTSLLAYLTGRPVKTTLNRKESLRLHPKRHPVWLHYKAGCDKDGRLTGMRVRIIGDKGAYASVGAKVLERAAGHSGGPYRIPNVDVEALAVYTNNPPCGAMRGFGANQSAFAIEGVLDMLAEKVGIDGWDMRDRNIMEEGDRFLTGQRMTKPFGLRKSLEAVKDVYRNSKFAGIACGIKNVGIGNGLPEAGRGSLEVQPDGRILIRTGFTEMGQGLFTVLIQTAVEETGLPHEIFEARTDTHHKLDCGQTTGSRGTVLGCYGVAEAAKKLRADLDALLSEHEALASESRSENDAPASVRSEASTLSEPRAQASAVRGPNTPPSPPLAGGEKNTAAPDTAALEGERRLAALKKLAGKVYEGEWICYKTDKFGANVPDPKTHLTYGFATQVVILNDDGTLKKVVAAHDVGRAINPTLLEGQMEGSLHMGLGYALTEEFACEGGRPLTEDVKGCGVLRAHHMPELEIIIIETPDPETPYGSKGVGEIGLVPTAPAVASALYAYDGIRRFTLPMKDSPAAEAILGKRKPTGGIGKKE